MAGICALKSLQCRICVFIEITLLRIEICSAVIYGTAYKGAAGELFLPICLPEVILNLQFLGQ